MAIRTGGIVSGLDTENIIKDLMKVEKSRVDRTEQSKQLSTWRKERYQEINKKFADFILDTKKEFGLSTTTTSGTYVTTSVEAMDWVKSATASNTDAISVNANSNAIGGSYRVKINNLATNWSSASADSLSSADDKTSLSSQFAGVQATDNIKFTITTNKGTLSVDKIAADTSISELVDEINSADIGVKAIYDEDSDRFFLQTDETGEENTFSILDESTSAGVDLNFIAGDAGDSNSVLKLQYFDKGTSTYKNVMDSTVETYKGEDASIDFGAATDIKYSSNNFTLNGIDMDLKQTTAEVFNIEVKTDVQGVYDKIKDFVEKYNEIVDDLNSISSERRNLNYKPLTEDQRDAMEKEEVELWEEKAKKGILSSDTIVDRIGSRMRSSLYQDVENVKGSFSKLPDIGIETSKYSSGSLGGTLTIDETKLKKAISEDADGVVSLLFKQSESITAENEDNLTTEEISKKRSESGVITRLYDTLVSGMKDIINKAGVGEDKSSFRKINPTMLLEFVTKKGSKGTLDKEITDYEKKIRSLKLYLADKEDSYWRKFSALETALSKMNSQSSWLAQQAGA